MPEVSIIIRTKNEEKWIGHCLAMIYRQDFKDFEVILVDNESSDHTVAIAQRYPLAKLIRIKEFIPGLALNDGIRASTGKYLVCLSAHCIPKHENWLSTLRANFATENEYAGVYGRQLPVSYTGDVDKRDLLIVFGQDRRVQVKDYFFHNANSMIRRSVWEKHPFDETVSNIEDRVWGKEVIAAGFQLVYDPEASVYHHHGLHQGNTPKRARGVVSIIERIDHDVLNDLPDSFKPDQIRIAAIIPIGKTIERSSASFRLLTESIAALKASKYINTLYIVSVDSPIASHFGVRWIDRSSISSVDTLGVDELLQKTLEKIEDQGDFAESLVYVNYDYLERPVGLIDELIVDAQYKGYDSVFAGYVDYGHFWMRDDNGDYKDASPSLRGRADREAVYRGLYGLGCVTSSALLRTGKLVGGKVGILPLDDVRYTRRLRDMEEYVDEIEQKVAIRKLKMELSDASL